MPLAHVTVGFINLQIYNYTNTHIYIYTCISNVGMQVHGHEYNFFIPARKNSLVEN
jgi:hypothetical protein